MTYPKSWKGESKTSSDIIKGETLTTNGFGDYGISNMSFAQVVLMHLEGYPVKKETLFWECVKCNNFNHYKQIICSQCNEKLDRG